jgi:Na+-transporting NADH:ubiquinone oxidoreductase subunit B
MLRKILDYQLSFFEKGKPLHRLKPLVSAGDTFFYEPSLNTRTGPHIRDAVDLKRWMIIVVFALMPCILWAIWNTGVQSFVYSSSNASLMKEYLMASASFNSYFEFIVKNDRWITILLLGLQAFLPVVIISYVVGGLWEAFFACVRGHEIAEGFLVTGILYPLILPPSIPYWMVAVGVSCGVVIGKELFGGSGMNILNPALTARCFLFFAYPNKVSGDVWVGTNPTQIQQSLATMNQNLTEEGQLNPFDGFSQATPLSKFNISTDIKRIQVDAIASNTLGDKVETFEHVNQYFNYWNEQGSYNATLGQLSPEQLKTFVTDSVSQGGLGLAQDQFQTAYEFAGLNYGLGNEGNWNFFFGNMLGSMGETSVFCCLLGVILLVWLGIGSWRTMVAMGIGAYVTALIFQMFSSHFGIHDGAWNPAKYAFPAYKHLLVGGLAFGLVFMVTDPVSSPGMNRSKWLYGLLVGMLVIVIRTVNPAYPEGVMLAILFGNVFAPLLDHSAIRNYRRKRRVTTS